MSLLVLTIVGTLCLVGSFHDGQPPLLVLLAEKLPYLRLKSRCAALLTHALEMIVSFSYWHWRKAAFDAFAQSLEADLHAFHAVSSRACVMDDGLAPLDKQEQNEPWSTH